MRFIELLEIVGDAPLFETELLERAATDVPRQLSRWTVAGQIYKLRRGLYALAPPYQKRKPHPFLIANALVKPSYVSLQSALAFYSLIPEHVPVTTSVTTGRPGWWETPLGRFEFRHVKDERFTDPSRLEVGDRQLALVATPEQALLDLIYLQPGSDSEAYLRELRLGNLEGLDLEKLDTLVGESPKCKRAAEFIRQLAQREGIEYETL